MTTWIILLLVFMLVTGVSFTRLALGAVRIVLQIAAAGLGVWLLSRALSGLSTAQGELTLLCVGGVLIVAEEVARHAWNKRHPHDRIGFDGKSVKR
ncbi:MAG TPA: hypothetical protein VF271_02265 [Rhodanobacteraceae bacterium]